MSCLTLDDVQTELREDPMHESCEGMQSSEAMHAYLRGVASKKFNDHWERDIYHELVAKFPERYRGIEKITVAVLGEAMLSHGRGLAEVRSEVEEQGFDPSAPWYYVKIAGAENHASQELMSSRTSVLERIQEFANS